MNLRGLAVLGGILALGGWLASSAAVWRGTAVAPSHPQPDVPPPPIAVEAAAVRDGIARLQERPGAPAFKPAGRNPFRFHERQPAPEPVPQESGARPVLSTASPSTPDLRLVGVAEDPGPDGPLRTAIVSGFDQLFMLKVGDLFGGHFKVLAVSADAIQVEDTTTGGGFTLTMR